MYEAFIDLDELIVRCRDKVSRKFIQEAVSCYRAGAFRSCIVATWNAVVFDFLHKLQELALFEDKKAKELLEAFEKLRSSGKQFKELWQFESNIPELAFKDFELISAVEKSDIQRLFEDRSRCAHPSMTSLEEPFEATAELARYHLRSAVTHLLQRPPVQGRTACERVLQLVQNESFPPDPEVAITYLRESPLARARFTLVKDAVLFWTKKLLIENPSDSERLRYLSALNAVSVMYPEQVLEILNSKLSEIIFNKVEDENLDRVIVYLGSVTAWDQVSESCILKIQDHIKRIEVINKQTKRISKEAIILLIKASRINFLSEIVAKQLEISPKYLIELTETCKDKLFIERFLIPALSQSASQATLEELFSMRSITALNSDLLIQKFIKEKMSLVSLKKLNSILFDDCDDWLIEQVEANLREKISSASLKDLLETKSCYKMISSPKGELLTQINSLISKCVEEQIEKFSLEDLIDLIEYEDDFFYDLIKTNLQSKISSADLSELLAAQSAYKTYIEDKKQEIVESFDSFVSQKVKDASIEDLILQIRFGRQIADELIKPKLKENIPTIIDELVESDSFDSAGTITNLLIKVAEYLSVEQWERVLENFFKNYQIYSSSFCYAALERLFKKSLEISGFIQPYWLVFRERLNAFDARQAYNFKRFNSFKDSINSLMGK